MKAPTLRQNAREFCTPFVGPVRGAFSFGAPKTALELGHRLNAVQWKIEVTDKVTMVLPT